MSQPIDAYPGPEEFFSKKWLCGVGFAVMDNQQGPKVVFEFPSGVLPLDSFNHISNCIICETIPNIDTITFLHQNYYLVGSPVKIENTAYERNSFLFNVFFILKSAVQGVPAHLQRFKLVASAVARQMKKFEIETKILSTFNDDASAKCIANIFQGLYNAMICNKTSCIIQCDQMSRSFVLELRKGSLRASDVPVVVQKPQKIENQWGQKSSKILPFIDGSNSLETISSQSSIQLCDVIDTVDSLIGEYDVVAIVPPYSKQTTFAVGPNFNQIFHSDNVRNSLCEHCFIQTSSSLPTNLSHELYGCVIHLLVGLVSEKIQLAQLPYLLSNEEKKLINLNALIHYSLASQILRVDKSCQVEIYSYCAGSKSSSQNHFSYFARDSQNITGGSNSQSIRADKVYSSQSPDITYLFI